MRKILAYSLGVLGYLAMPFCHAVEKFEVLPDLPEALKYTVQPVNAASVTGSTDVSTLGVQSVGNEPSLISVVLSLIFVILLIYLTGIIYAKLNRVGFKTLKRQQREQSSIQVSVLSTTPLGGNKTLHVVELDGKRMLIGASAGAIQLLKDLGNIDSNGSADEYSHIEIPNIKIPKIEIPKIEIPTINFSKLVTKTHKAIEQVEKESVNEEPVSVPQKESVEEENSDGIIDSLFTTQVELQEIQEDKTTLEHTVDPDDFALYKKYLS